MKDKEHSKEVRQHYLPRFYLDGFTDPCAPKARKSEPYVWVYSADTHTWRRRAPRNVAAESGYYTVFDPNGKQSNEVEDVLSQIESRAAPAVRKVLKRELPDRGDRTWVATFVALMLLRVPALHNRVARSMSEIGRLILAVDYQQYTQHPEQLEAFKDNYRRETGKADLDALTPEAFDPRHYKISPNRAVVVGTALSQVRHLADAIEQMGWSFLVSDPPDYFITSDCPLYMVDPTIEHPWFRHGLKQSNVEVTLPLSRDAAFFADWHHQGCRWVTISGPVVELINVRSALAASEFLVAPNKDFPGVASVTGAIRQLRKRRAQAPEAGRLG